MKKGEKNKNKKTITKKLKPLTSVHEEVVCDVEAVAQLIPEVHPLQPLLVATAELCVQLQQRHDVFVVD